MDSLKLLIVIYFNDLRGAEAKGVQRVENILAEFPLALRWA